MYKIYEIDPSIKGKELTKEFYSSFTDVERSELNKKVEEALKNSIPYVSERFIEFPDGRKKWIRGSGVPIANPDGTVQKIEGIAQDLTESKLAELTILQNVKDKETLLKELHHRVKNNLQVISSILNLQSSMIEDDQIKSIFQDSQQRIKSMASIHDLLYKSADLSEIKFAEYITNLIHDAVLSYRGQDHNVRLNIDMAKDLLFQLDVAVPLGLFVNEVITNSLKHGIKDSGEPQIAVSIIKGGNKNFTLSISDNGRGFDPNKKSNESLGMMLIESLANQLEGNMTLATGQEGTAYTLEF
jgi:two-component sensor histidine kinase